MRAQTLKKLDATLVPSFQGRINHVANVSVETGLLPSVSILGAYIEMKSKIQGKGLKAKSSKIFAVQN